MLRRTLGVVVLVACGGPAAPPAGPAGPSEPRPPTVEQVCRFFLDVGLGACPSASFMRNTSESVCGDGGCMLWLGPVDAGLP